MLFLRSKILNNSRSRKYLEKVILILSGLLYVV